MQSSTDGQEVWPPAYKSSTRRTHPKHTSRRPPTVPLRSPDERGNTHATQDRNGHARPALSPKAGPAHRAPASPPLLRRYALQEEVPKSQCARAFQVCGVSTGRRGSSGTVIPANQSTAHHAPTFYRKKKNVPRIRLRDHPRSYLAFVLDTTNARVAPFSCIHVATSW